MTDLTCSIIINTYNRAPYVRRLLPGLARLRDAQFEIIVVNGPSTDGTVSVLQDYRDRIKVVDCPTRNLSQSRNIGIAQAAGDIVVFIDDDAIPVDEDWLARYTQAFARDTTGHLGAVGGAVLHRDTDRFEFNGGITSDYGIQVFDRPQTEQAVPDGHRWVRGTPGGNSAFRRAALVSIGGFDEFYTYYLDETDACFRLARAGYDIAYLPDNGIRHYAVRAQQTNQQLAQRWQVITRSDTYFSLKNGADFLLLRLVKTLWKAPRKHFFKEVLRFRPQTGSTTGHRLTSLAYWLSGLLRGLRAGVFRQRSLGNFRTSPPAFLPFARPEPACPLRIALLSQTVPGQPNYGGIGRYVYDLALGLHERGHEVHIFCKDDQPVRRESLGFEIHGISSDESRRYQNFGSRHPVLNKNLSHSLAVAKQLSDLYAQGTEFDVVHIPNWDAEGAALVRAQVYPTVMVIVTSLAQTILAEQWPLTDDLRLCIDLDRWQIEQADLVCSPSAGVWKSYEKLMGITPETMRAWRVVPLGIVPEHPPAQARRAGRYRLLFVGRLERRKGAHTLLSVLPELLAAHPDWECHLVGDDQIKVEGSDTFKRLFLEEHAGAPWLSRVVFHGVVTEQELREHYRDCDLFVAPSLFESYGLIYHEAMQYSKAVVGCRTGGVPETVEDGVEGVLVTPDNPDELRAALTTLMDNQILREQMGQAGAEHVHQRANFRTLAAGMEQAYLDTISAVGEKCRNQRAQLWPRVLPLWSDTTIIQKSGSWQSCTAANGSRYLMGLPDAELAFTVQGQAIIHITALRHAWSGMLSLSNNCGWREYLDLYQPSDQGQSDDLYRIVIPGDPRQDYLLTCRILPIRNPESRGSEVWLKEIARTDANFERNITVP